MAIPAILIDGYLILEGVTSNRTPESEIENAIVAVNINDKAGTIMVVFSGIGQRFGQPEYFCTMVRRATDSQLKSAPRSRDGGIRVIVLVRTNAPDG